MAGDGAFQFGSEVRGTLFEQVLVLPSAGPDRWPEDVGGGYGRYAPPPLRVGPPGDGRGDGACARPCFQRDARAIERGKGRAFDQIILCQRANSFSFPNQ